VSLREPLSANVRHSLIPHQAHGVGTEEKAQAVPPVHHLQVVHGAAGIWSIWVALLIAAGWESAARADSLCQTCEVQIGLGGTYHFWGTTGGIVLPVIVAWGEGRYELGLFRVTTQQVLVDSNYPSGRVMADPYWGVSVSRRWRLFEQGPVRLFFGFGVAAKTESDELSCTRLDFASQLGLRFRFPGDRIVGELTMRHWSNGGMRLPNHGQDVATLTFRLNTGRFGIDRGERISLAALERFPDGLNDPDNGVEALP
jgi:hypothetical protein